MKILCVGDIFGEPGREALRRLLPGIISKHRIDFVLVNVDNAAGGKGLTDAIADELFQLPIHVMTAGNHIWEHNSIHGHLETHPILRPYNVEGKQRGKGFCIAAGTNGIPVGILHLQGRVFMESKGLKTDSPFRAVDGVLQELESQTRIIIVDVHAEATAEKKAIGWYLDGRVSAVIGTHTHVQTADEQILPHRTAYITDMGMTGPHGSIIGMDPEVALKRFLSDGQFKKFKVGKDNVQLQGVVIQIDEGNGAAVSIQRIQEKL